MYKIDLNLAESVLRAYEYRMRDTVRQGHCCSAEWRYQANETVGNNLSSYSKFAPEIFDMVQKVMQYLCLNHRPVWAILMSKYSRVSPFYKRQTRAALSRNQSRRYSSREWAYEIERSLGIFWQEMQKQPQFLKYFSEYIDE